VPALLKVSGVTPAVSEVQDTLSIHGAGFAEGSPARVTLEGRVVRAGAEGEAVFVEGAGYAESREHLTVQLSQAMIEALCGVNEPRHATFVGDVTVAFRPQTAGAPPVVGRLKETRLDFYPSPESQVLPADPGALAEFWGAEMGRPPAAEGLLVTAVGEGGVAQRAGLSAGDRVVQFGDLTARGLSDLEPYPGQRRAALWVHRGDARHPFALEADVSGYAPRPARAWALGLGVCSAAALALLLSRGPLAPALAWLLTRQNRAPREAGRALPSWPPRPVAASGERGLVPFLLVSGFWATFTLGLVRVPADLDLVVVLGLYASSLLVSQMLGGGMGSRAWSLWRSLRSVARGLLIVGVTLIAAIPAVVAASSLSLRDLVEQQAGYPWEYAVFRSPSSYVVCGLLFSLVVLQCIGVAPAEGSRGSQSALRRGFLRAVRSFEWVHLLLLCGLICALYLGGFAWDPAWGTRYGRLGPALLFQAKFTLLYLLVLWARGSVPRVSEHYLQGLYWRRLLPLAIVAALVSPAWTVAAWPSWLHHAALSSLTTLTLFALAAVVLARRRAKGAVASLNPWL
jgi:NADH-quinone oxidoreductase subunit H